MKPFSSRYPSMTRAMLWAGVAACAVGAACSWRFRRWAFGWRASFPWQPDVSSRIVLIGALLLVTAALRLANLLRRATKAPQEGSVSEVRGSSPPPIT